VTVIRVYRYRCVGKVAGRVKYRIRVVAKSHSDAEDTARKWAFMTRIIANDNPQWDVYKVSDMDAMFADLGR
jgi:hypothetical protein